MSTEDNKTRVILLLVAAVGSALLYRVRSDSMRQGFGRDVKAYAAARCAQRARPPRPWRCIVVHHSATSRGNAAMQDRYHRHVKRWRHGLGYHFVIGNGTDSRDGEIEVGERWRKQLPGAHCGSLETNRVAIGLCLVGNFEEGRPTEAQMASLIALTRCLCREFRIPPANVLVHREVRGARTLCPGKFFPAEAFRKSIQSSSSAPLR